MDREEALRTLGLDDDATIDDVKTAYKEMVQILHPDRFAGNKKLQNRATEQFKNLQEAYEYLTSGKAEAQRARSGKASGQRQSRAYATATSELEARLAGIAAARVQLVAQRDSLLDSRRNGVILIVGGLFAAFFLRRFGPVAAVGGAAVIWGIIDLISTTTNIRSLDGRLDELNKEKAKILAKLEELDEE
jgi:curved DNA-binding protein CbpA